MKFHSYSTIRDVVRKLDPRGTYEIDDFYDGGFLHSVVDGGEPGTGLQCYVERLWEVAGRPYYSVYPAIAPMLANISMDLDTRFIKLPQPAFSVRFCEDRPPLSFEWGGKPWHIRSMIVGPGKIRVSVQKFGPVTAVATEAEPSTKADGLILWADTGEMDLGPDGNYYPLHSYVNIPIESGLTLEQALHALPTDGSALEGMILPEEIKVACVRIVAAICLLKDDPSIIEPDVLNADREKWERSQDTKFVARAKRRGKFGWTVGRKIEVIPHIRRPHLALFHTGPHGAVPQILPRKGSVIHREIVEKVPTGYEEVRSTDGPE